MQAIERNIDEVNKSPSLYSMTGDIKHVNTMMVNRHALSEVLAHIDKLEAENERLRMQVVACGVVAMADTPASSVEARNMHPDYKSASCDDVARRVDECITLRAEVERLRKDAERLDFLDINQHWRMGWTVGRSPVGNISVKAVVQLDGATTSIREAIDAAMKGTP